MSIGKFILTDVEHRWYIEIDQIRLIFEEGELVGWYRP